jgi:polar amino acid transport system substrate-binding protein
VLPGKDHRVGGRRLAITGAVLVALLAGCDWPRDAAGTLDQVRGGTLRVGVTENPPWVVLQDEAPAGAEVRLVEALAADLEADIEWVEGADAELMEALHGRSLHLVIGGFDATAPWSRQVSLTRPYITTHSVVAVPSGKLVPSTLEGLEVTVELGSFEEAYVRSHGARPRLVSEIQSADGPVVVEDWRLNELGLVASDIEITTNEHVVAVPLGESGWQTHVERFLLKTPPDEVHDLLAQESSS